MAWQIKFGTDGWRGVIGEDFNFNNVLRVAEGLNGYLKQGLHKSRAKVIIGYDARFLAAEVAQMVGCWLFEKGHHVELSTTATASPAVSLAVRDRGADTGVMITASHNPPIYNGVKFKGSYGGSYLESMVTDLAKYVPGESPALRFNTSAYHWMQHISPQLTRVDLNQHHQAALLKFVDGLSLQGLKFVVDPMHGAGVNTLAGVLRQLGAEVIEIHGQMHPYFGGHHPEPLPQTTQELKAAVLAHKAAAGFALDGDADRIGGCDNQGEFLDSHRIFSLLLQHLVENRRWQGGVVKTVSTTDLIDKLCQQYQLPLTIVPVGFKNICKWMVEDKALLMGGEESGGIGICRYLPERDGALCALLLAELLANSRGKTLSVLIAELMQAQGAHYFQRLDYTTPPGQALPLLQRLQQSPPMQVDGHEVVEKIEIDGLKLRLSQGWVMWRGSGTEPLLRIYAESRTPAQAKALIAAAKAIVESLL